VDGGYQLAAGAALPPLLLDDEEAVALAVGLQTAAQRAVPGIAESSVRALAKVVQVMPSKLRRQVDAVRTVTQSPSWGDSGPAVDPSVLVSVVQVCRDTERLEFGYTAAGGEVTERHVEPLRLVRLGRRWYLVAYDLARHDWRSFRLDRLAGPRRTGVRFRPRELPASDAVSFVQAGLRHQPTQYATQVVMHAPAERVRAKVGRWATVEAVDEHSCRLHMRSDSLDWPALALGSLGAEFTVVDPPELLTYLGEWAARFTRAGARAGEPR
jgi:predicted DNA-binding transcriptional regulator YafY